MALADRNGVTTDVPDRDVNRVRCPAPHSDFRRVPTCGQWFDHPHVSFWEWLDPRNGDPVGLIYPTVCCRECARPWAWNPDLETSTDVRERVEMQRRENTDGSSDQEL